MTRIFALAVSLSALTGPAAAVIAPYSCEDPSGDLFGTPEAYGTLILVPMVWVPDFRGPQVRLISCAGQKQVAIGVDPGVAAQNQVMQGVRDMIGETTTYSFGDVARRFAGQGHDAVETAISPDSCICTYVVGG